jgi:hypothetical protein
MGLLSGLTNFVNNKVISPLQNIVERKVSTATREKVVSATNTALTVLTSPIGAITNFKKTKEQTAKKSTLKLVAEGVENTLLVVAPFTSAGKTLATKAVSTAFGSVKATATTLVLGGAIASSPTIRNTAINLATPSNLIGTGEKIGNIVEKTIETGSNPSGTEDLIKGTLGAVAGLGVAGLAVAGGKILIDDIKDGGLIDSKELSTASVTPSSQIAGKVLETDQQTPPIAETVTLPKGEKTNKKRKRAKQKKQPQNIIQRTNILINNRNSQNKLSTKRYLNARVHRN